MADRNRIRAFLLNTVKGNLIFNLVISLVASYLFALMQGQSIGTQPLSSLLSSVIAIQVGWLMVFAVAIAIVLTLVATWSRKDERLARTEAEIKALRAEQELAVERSKPPAQVEQRPVKHPDSDAVHTIAGILGSDGSMTLDELQKRVANRGVDGTSVPRLVAMLQSKTLIESRGGATIGMAYGWQGRLNSLYPQG